MQRYEMHQVIIYLKEINTRVFILSKNEGVTNLPSLK
jgi:hypothetical protein